METNMMKKIASTLAAAVMGLTLASGAKAEGVAFVSPAAPELEWSFNGLFGSFEKASLQRGFQVYKEVCSGCHSMDLLAYRHLEAIGYNEDQVKAIAAEYTVMDGPNDVGEMFERPARPSDHFKAPFANEEAARAAFGGAYPPDLSLMAKAREGGPDYIHALLVGYGQTPPADLVMNEGSNFNPYFPGGQIAMPQPLTDGAVTYQDGTEATVDQMAYDVANFLMWAAEPNMESRHRIGLQVMLFLLVMTGILYAAKRKIWSDVH